MKCLIPILASASMAVLACSDKSNSDKSKEEATTAKKEAAPAPEATPPKEEGDMAAVQKASSPLSDEERKVLQQCAKDLPTVTTEDEEDKAGWFIARCGVGVGAGFENLMKPGESVESKHKMLSSTDVFCKPELATSAIAGERVDSALLVKECGPAYYGLQDDQAKYMSIGWFLFQRTTAWLLERRAQLNAADASTEDKELYQLLGKNLIGFEAVVSVEGERETSAIITPDGAAIVVEGSGAP